MSAVVRALTAKSAYARIAAEAAARAAQVGVAPSHADGELRQIATRLAEIAGEIERATMAVSP